MSMRVVLKEECRKLKDLTWKERFGYIWDYYKPVMAGIICVILVVSVAAQIITNSRITTELSVALINSSQMQKEPDTFHDNFVEYAGLDGERKEVLFDYSYQTDPGGNDTMTYNTQMKVMAVIAANDMDVMVMNKEVYEHYVKNDLFLNLEEILTDPQYADLASMTVSTSTEENPEDHPYAFCIKGSQQLAELMPFEEVYVALIANTKRAENAMKFVEYVLAEF